MIDKENFLLLLKLQNNILHKLYNWNYYHFYSSTLDCIFVFLLQILMPSQ